MTAHNAAAPLLWKASVSVLLCFGGAYMSPRISRFILSLRLSFFFFSHPYAFAPWKHLVSKGMYDCCLLSVSTHECAPFNVTAWNTTHVGRVSACVCVCVYWGFLTVFAFVLFRSIRAASAILPNFRRLSLLTRSTNTSDLRVLKSRNTSVSLGSGAMPGCINARRLARAQLR